MNLLKNKMGMRVLTLALCAALGGSVLAVKAESVYDGITLLCLVNGMIIAFLHLSGTCLHYDGFDAESLRFRRDFSYFLNRVKNKTVGENGAVNRGIRGRERAKRKKSLH